MLLYRLEDGTSDFWSVGEPKPTINPLSVVYIHASGPELDHLSSRVPVGLQPSAGAVGLAYVGDLAGTVWVNL